MNGLEFKNLFFKLKMRGLSIPRLYTIDMVRHHNRGMSGETWKHYLCKCVCSKILYDARRPHFCEFEFPNKTVADIFEVADFRVIEFESTKNHKESKNVQYHLLSSKGFISDYFIIDISELPDDFIGIERELRRILNI